MRVQTQGIGASKTVNFDYPNNAPPAESDPPSAAMGDSAVITPTNNHNKLQKKGTGKSKSTKKYSRIESKLKTAGKLHGGKNMTIK